MPDDAEIAANPRARSAKLRAAERTDSRPLATSRPFRRYRRLRMSWRNRLAAVDRTVLLCVGRCMRLLNLLVIVALVVAAAYVYGIKFDLTQRVERAAKLRAEIRRERDAIAALRAEWAKLDNPARVQGLAARHLRLRPLEAAQFDSLDRLPKRPPARSPGTRPIAHATLPSSPTTTAHRQRSGRAGDDRHAMTLQPPPAEPWRRRLIRNVLYGSDVDRGVKARARVGLAVIAFALVLRLIAVRLIMFAVAPEGHNVRRTVGQDAVGTARPDIFDRNGQVLATDVRSPSLFGEPHRIIDIDEAVDC